MNHCRLDRLFYNIEVFIECSHSTSNASGTSLTALTGRASGRWSATAKFGRSFRIRREHYGTQFLLRDPAPQGLCRRSSGCRQCPPCGDHCRWRSGRLDRSPRSGPARPQGRCAKPVRLYLRRLQSDLLRQTDARHLEPARCR